MKGLGNLSLQSMKDPKGLTDGNYGCEKVEKTFWFVLYLYFNDSAFTAVRVIFV